MDRQPRNPNGPRKNTLKARVITKIKVCELITRGSISQNYDHTHQHFDPTDDNNVVMLSHVPQNIIHWRDYDNTLAKIYHVHIIGLWRELHQNIVKILEMKN